MMRVRGTVRSQEDWEHEGSGPTAARAREVAVEGLPEDYDLVDVQTVSARPGEPVTVKAFGRRTLVQTVEAEGADEPSALAALRGAVPPGFLLLNLLVDPQEGQSAHGTRMT